MIVDKVVYWILHYTQSLQKISLSISLLRTKLDVVNFNVWVPTTLYYVYSVENQVKLTDTLFNQQPAYALTLSLK